ncbi:tyrosine-type recombinase/integrase [Microvirga sp. TS319]|uniref:tyrosine-type recombinase/integrase n=1 Tax=Microvirga sp. TS319 TaxID=3241165 RepID=UPI00351AA020
MAHIKLPYVQEFVDRHGKVRRYFRRNGKRTPLPGLPGSKEFRLAYEAAMAGNWDGEQQDKDTSPPGSMSRLIALYYSSATFKGLEPITQSSYRNEIEKIRRDHGDKRVAMLRREHVKKLFSEKADKPGAANKFLRHMRTLMRFAIDENWRGDDPTFGIRKMKIKDGGFRAWTDDDIAAFEAKWPVGSRERLALSLLLYTAQRRSDVIRMGWQHVRNGMIQVKQQKTGTPLWIPIHPNLNSVLQATPRANMTFLMTAKGKPFTSAGFGNYFSEASRDARCSPGCSAHGLRKAAARRLAEAGCTSKQIQAVTGHKSLDEVERYTKEVEQVLLAQQAMALVSTKPKRPVSNRVSTQKKAKAKTNA